VHIKATSKTVCKESGHKLSFCSCCDVKKNFKQDLIYCESLCLTNTSPAIKIEEKEIPKAMIKMGATVLVRAKHKKILKAFKRSPGGQFTELARMKIFRFRTINPFSYIFVNLKIKKRNQINYFFYF